jgi:molybdenum cofactor sulfurtransferase
VVRKAYFGGGTVAAVAANVSYHVPRPSAAEWLADGTPDYIGIASIERGLDIVEGLTMAAIQAHTSSLREYTVRRLRSLVHANGTAVCSIYEIQPVAARASQGPIINLNFRRPDGGYVGYSEVEQLALSLGLQIRTGTFCNPGASQRFLNLSHERIASNFEAGHVCWDALDLIDTLPTGSVRVSFGYMSVWEDADAFCEFCRECFVYSGPQSYPALECTPKSSPRGKRPDCSTVGPDGKHSASIVLDGIFVYPIKSCAAQSVSSWPISAAGLDFDRQWAIMLLDGTALNQKREPKLATIRPVVHRDRGVMTVEAPGMDTLTIPLAMASLATVDAQRVQQCAAGGGGQALRVCGRATDGHVYGDEVNAWFSRHLGRLCVLVRKLRASEPRPQFDGSFANEAAVLLLSRASVDDLNSRLQRRHVPLVASDRFRPNLVVSGCAAYAEDGFGELRIGDLRLCFKQPCTRCTLVNIDQRNAQLGRQPLLELTSYRAHAESERVLFGVLMDVCPKTPDFILRLRSVVEVSSRAPIPAFSSHHIAAERSNQAGNQAGSGLRLQTAPF